MARREPAGASWRPRVHLQVEHGLDARHPEYIKQDPVHRRWHHKHSPSRCCTRSRENFILPFSHDEVVHGKRSLLDKMPGDVWQKHATLRTLFGLHVRTSRQEAVVHGRRVRPVARVESRPQSRLASAARAAARRAPALRAGSELALPGASPRSMNATSTPDGFQLDRLQRQRKQRRVVRPLRARSSRFVVMVVQLHARPAARYRIGVPEPGRYVELLNSDSALMAAATSATSAASSRARFLRTASSSR